jgi:hypothetical protein
MFHPDQIAAALGTLLTLLQVELAMITDHCALCGANLKLVGRAHRCVPVRVAPPAESPAAETLSLPAVSPSLYGTNRTNGSTETLRASRPRSREAERKALQRSDPAARAAYNSYQKQLMRRRRAADRQQRAAATRHSAPPAPAPDTLL